MSEDSENNEMYIKQARQIITSKTGMCFAGGGVLGLGEIGALNRWIEQGGDLRKITHIVGASVGSMIASVIACGADIDFIKRKMDIDMKTFQDGPNVFVKMYRFFKKYGWYEGKKLRTWVGEIIGELTGDSEITMLEAYAKTGVHLTLVYNSLNFIDAFYIDHLTEPNTKLKDAIRFSSSLPLAFEACFRQYLTQSGTYANDIIIDGGTIDNYPMHVLRDQGLTDMQIIGFKLCSTDEIKEYAQEVDYNSPKYDFGEPNGLTEYIIRLITLMRSMAMRVHVKSTDWILTVKINVANMQATDFDITTQQKRDLYEAGELSIDQIIADTARLLEENKYPFM